MKPSHPMKLLLLKVWRDALSMTAASVSLAILVALGTALFVALAQSRYNLVESYNKFYVMTRFADATIWVDGAPPNFLETVRAIPHVREAMGLQVKDATILLRGHHRRQAIGRFIGIPATGRLPMNDLIVVRGRYAVNRNECLIEQLFARENKLQPGDHITGNYVGRTHEFVIAGIVASPEYLFPVASKEASFISPQTFGVCWINEDVARQWLGLGKVITEIHVITDPGDQEGVLIVLKSLGERFGLRTSWTQVDQPSNHLLSLDLQGFEVLSVIFPLLFMLAAGLSLYSSLTRIIQMQTGIIGFLRASGFSRTQVLWHYLLEAALVTVVGCIPGLIIGHILSVGLVTIYINELNLPVSLTSMHPGIMLTAFVIASMVAGAAALIPARRAALTPPAIAMRGTDRQNFGTLQPWLAAFTNHFSVLFRIPVRGLLGRPSRTALVVCGVASGTSLMVVSLGMGSSVYAIINEMFETVYRYQLAVSFIGPSGAELADAVSTLPGVRAVDHTCLTVVKARSLRADQTLTLMGIERGQTALHIRKVGGGLLTIAPGDFWISKSTAERLKVEPGDPLYLEWAYSSRQKRVRTVVQVRGLLDLSLGGMIYGEYSDVRRRIVDKVYPESGYGAQILCSPVVSSDIERRFERSDLTASVTNITEMRKQITDSLGIMILFVSVLVAFSATLAGAVLHSVSTVGIIERLRELATLRSLGFSIRQTGWIAAVEVYTLALLGLILGIPLGIWMNVRFLAVYNTETFNFEPSLPLWIFPSIMVIVFGLVALSLRAGLHRLRMMDLAQATKARE